MSMVLRLESSCVNLTVIVNDIVLVVATCWVSWLTLWYYWYILISILSWPMISTQYPCFVLTPTFMFSSCLFVGVQQTCRHLRLNSNSSQSSLLRISGWANAPSSDWIFLFMSWCLEVPAWTSFYVFLSS